MKLKNKFKSAYSDASREILFKLDALYALHIMLFTVIIIVTILYIPSNQYWKIPISGSISAGILISFIIGFKGKYNISAFFLTTLIYSFLAFAALTNPEIHPYAPFRTGFYLVAPTILSSLLMNDIKFVYGYSFITLSIVVGEFTLKTVPGNPETPLSELISSTLAFSILILFFIAHFTFRKHRVIKNMENDTNDMIVEINDKADQITRMLKKVKQSIKITTSLLDEVKLIQTKVTDSNNKMNNFLKDMNLFEKSFQESSSNLETIGDQIQNLNTNVYNQSSAQEVSATATNQMVASISNVAGIVDKKSQSAKELMHTIVAGGDQLENTVDIIETISNSVDSILELVSIINNISDQTNLLSMNAAIEAAHAGDSGKGFAVVAEEIRKLAEESSSNVTNISNVLSDVVAKIESSNQAGKETLQAFNRIHENVKETNNAFEEISHSTKELNTGTNEILDSITKLTGLSEDVNAGTSLIHNSQKEIQEQLGKTGSRVSGIIDDINSINRGNTEIAQSIIKINNIVEDLKSFSEEVHV